MNAVPSGIPLPLVRSSDASMPAVAAALPAVHGAPALVRKKCRRQSHIALPLVSNPGLVASGLVRLAVVSNRGSGGHT